MFPWGLLQNTPTSLKGRSLSLQTPCPRLSAAIALSLLSPEELKRGSEERAAGWRETHRERTWLEWFQAPLGRRLHFSPEGREQSWKVGAETGE